MRWNVDLLNKTLCLFLAWMVPRAAAAVPAASFAKYELRADGYWRVELPGGVRFDASGLAVDAEGRLFTVHDRDAGVWRLDLPNTSETTNAHMAHVTQVTNCFTPAQLQRYAREKSDRYDVEGLSLDGRGNFYICEEANRWIMRANPVAGTVERLDIDWLPVRRYFSGDSNSSFEGLAVGDGNRLYVANERDDARVIVVDLGTLRIVDDFQVWPREHGFGFLHYSDLAWHKGSLFVLCRHHQVVLKVEPRAHRVLAEYHYKSVEEAPDHLYNNRYPTGVMEGLAVDDLNFWMITDNNGEARKQNPKDRRPTLFRCARPDVVK